MLRVVRLEKVPENFDRYVEEIATGLHQLYGQAAAADYRLRARRSFGSSLLHPSVSAFGALQGGTLAGIVLGFQREKVGEISLLHVLKEYEGQGVEQRLARRVVQALQARPVDTILFECLSLCRLDLGGIFQRLKFQHLARELMLAPLRTPGLQPALAPLSRPCTPEEWPLLAACIVAAYQGHPEARLHREVNAPQEALDFVRRVAAGNYGTVQEELIRIIPGPQGCQAGILACQVAPDTGFVLQLVAKPEARRKGYGRALLQETAEVLRTLGFTSLALGVTTSNSARNLYVALGFQRVLPVDAYVWWRRPL